MAEQCDGGSVQPANETLLDHPLMHYDEQLVEDVREVRVILPNRIHNSQGQEIRETSQTSINDMQHQPQHQKTRKQRINRYCRNCFRNTQHACWTCCTKCYDCKCFDGDCCDIKSCSNCFNSCCGCYYGVRYGNCFRNTQRACWTCCTKCCDCKCSDCDCCDVRSCSDCVCCDVRSCSDCFDLCCCCNYRVRYQFRECCGSCFLPCVTLIRWTGGIFAMIVVTVTVILLTLTAYGAIDCTISSIPTIVALGIILALTGVCICTFKYEMYQKGLCLLFFIALFLGIFFTAAVVIDSVYVINADFDPEQQSTTSTCNKYYNIMYIALSYFYALIVFTCCGCVCTYCMTRPRRFCK